MVRSVELQLFVDISRCYGNLGAGRELADISRNNCPAICLQERMNFERFLMIKYADRDASISMNVRVCFKKMMQSSTTLRCIFQLRCYGVVCCCTAQPCQCAHNEKPQANRDGHRIARQTKIQPAISKARKKQRFSWTYCNPMKNDCRAEFFQRICDEIVASY